MNLDDLVAHATDKSCFKNLEDYIAFCERYLNYIETNLQARIISKNENNYQFLQYREEGGFNVTRPLNAFLMYDAESFSHAAKVFSEIFDQLRHGQEPAYENRYIIMRMIYTLQQSIGATLDALPSGMSNQARKVNGDLFERLIRLLIISLDIQCVSGTIKVPVKDSDGNELFKSSYQHDLLISKDSELKVIGSVKTSSKDRIDKVFMDKFLYSKLTDTMLPHIAIFLNDVQRKKTKLENEYGISTTFLPGHFKAYTIKLNSLDGVYYCDIRPNMLADDLLSKYIKTIDCLFYSDLRRLIDEAGQNLENIDIEPVLR
jgi:hypothetical protein